MIESDEIRVVFYVLIDTILAQDLKLDVSRVALFALGLLFRPSLPRCSLLGFDFRLKLWRCSVLRWPIPRNKFINTPPLKN